MKRVYKFEVAPIGSEYLLPKNAKVIHIGVQHHKVYVWIELDPDAKLEYRKRFYCFGTGHDIHDNIVHCGSVQDGDYVWHVYKEVLP